jgi:hypothetical protein
LSALTMSKRIIWAHTWRSPSRVAGRARLPRWEQALLVCLMVASAVLLALTLGVGFFRARADAGAYLIEVAMRLRYNFASGADALAYGDQFSDKVSGGRPVPRTDLAAAQLGGAPQAKPGITTTQRRSVCPID